MHPWLLLPVAHQADDELPSGTIVLCGLRLVQPRSYSDACPLGRWGSIGETQKLPHKKVLSIARSEKTLFSFSLTYCEGPQNYLITRKTTKRSTVCGNARRDGKLRHYKFVCFSAPCSRSIMHRDGHNM